MELTINGKKETVTDDPNAMLLWVLRDDLEMTGTKFGCGVGICGSCTVHVDGEATRACITPLANVDGKEIRTIEGLAEADGTLHPMQEAFVEKQVPQCGWCMSGQIMTAVSFLDANPNPNEEDIVAAMGNNYCRCGCYTRIYDAIATAAGVEESA